MSNPEKVKMYINVAGEHVMLSIPFDRQDFVRDTEREIASLHASWKRRFPEKNDRELLAMIVYQYASFYYELLERQEQSAGLAEECLAEVRAMRAGADAVMTDGGESGK